MGLDTALSIASGGLSNINAQFALLSQNVANAATPGYAVEVGSQQSLTADGVGLGVHTGPATLQIDQALQASVVQQDATVAGLQTTQTSLQAIDSVLGAPGAGSDLGSLLGNLQNSFSTLLTDPSNQAQQSAVVQSAATLARGINTLSGSYAAQRQAAQNDLGSAVSTLNSTLATIGQLSDQIIALKPTTQSTADLENLRNEAVQTLSQLVSVKTVNQSNGDLLLYTAGGLSLPTRGAPSPFSLPGASTATGTYYPGGGIQGIMLGGADVTNLMQGGRIGADITLRDTTLPTDQAALDEFAQGLSSRFAAQGLTLFTAPGGPVAVTGATQAGYVGYAETIQVDPTVSANPSLVRDGTNAIAGSPAGAAAFTPNPATGPAGFTALIQNIVSFTFGTQAQNAVPQTTLNTAGLGASGTLAVAFGAAGDTLGDFANSLVSAQSQQSATATNNLTTEQALQTSLSAKVTSVSGVNMDTELSQMLSLQNAYSANARVMTAVQSMFTQLLQAVQ
jgi:flagellar hook-associated protein 1 FlgK